MQTSEWLASRHQEVLVLAEFVERMKAELAANAGKGDRAGWMAMSPRELLAEIQHHYAKLHTVAIELDRAQTLRGSGRPVPWSEVSSIEALADLVGEFAVDVANLSMMLADRVDAIGVGVGFDWGSGTCTCDACRLTGLHATDSRPTEPRRAEYIIWLCDRCGDHAEVEPGGTCEVCLKGIVREVKVVPVAEVAHLRDALDDAVSAVWTGRVSHAPNPIYTPQVSVERVERWRAALSGTSAQRSHSEGGAS